MGDESVAGAETVSKSEQKRRQKAEKKATEKVNIVTLIRVYDDTNIQLFVATLVVFFSCWSFAMLTLSVPGPTTPPNEEGDTIFLSYLFCSHKISKYCKQCYI
jgi:hypothetical protein